MIRQLLMGLVGLVLVGVALFAFAFAVSVPELMAGLVLAVAGGSLLTWAVGAS